MHDLQIHGTERLRVQRMLTGCLHKWCRRSARRCWAQRAATAFKARWHTSTTLSSTRHVWRGWARATRNLRRFVVTRWELLAVGATVCGLGSGFAPVRGRVLAAPRKRMQRAVRTTREKAEAEAIISDDSSARSARVSSRSQTDDAMFPHGMAALRLNLTMRRHSNQPSPTEPSVCHLSGSH